MMFAKRLVGIPLLLAFCFSLNLWGQETTRTPAPKLKIGVMGASVSAGFGSDYTLSEAIGAAIRVPHETFDYADNFFFSSYHTSSPKIIAKMKSRKVDVIMALDYLFWFATGKKTLAERKQFVTDAISFLDEVKIPVLVGTIPEMRNVSQFMLRRDRIIPKEQIPILNEHLETLVKKRKHIHLVPLAMWIDCLNANKTVPGMEDVSSETLTKSEIFLADGLHLNRKGLVFAAAMMVKKLHNLGIVLNAKNSTCKVKNILAELSKNDSAIQFEVRRADGSLAKDGLLRIKIPTVQQLMSSGTTMDEIVKLRSLSKYAKPISLKNNNPARLTGIPAAAAKLKVKARAEGPDFAVSAWQSLSLKAGRKLPYIFVLDKPNIMRLRFVGSKTKEAISGIQVASRTEARNMGFGSTKNLPENFPARGTTDANGEVTLTGIGPESQRLVIKTSSGKFIEKTIELDTKSKEPKTILIED